MTIEDLIRLRDIAERSYGEDGPKLELAWGKLAMIGKLADYGCNPEDMVNDIREVLDL